VYANISQKGLDKGVILKRDISTINILIMSAGGMIGSGWLFSPFISAQIAGTNALVAWVIAAIFMMFIALPLCELGSMMPVSGGLSNYPTYTHGKEVGFLFAWTAWLSYVVMTPIEVQAILQYSSHFFPSLVLKDTTTLSLSPTGYIVAFFIMFGVVILNTFGIKKLSEYNTLASIIKFILPTTAIVSLLYMSPTRFAVNLHLSRLEDWKEIFMALSAGGIAFAFTGFQNGLMLAGEVKNPQRNLPISILGAIVIGFLLYFMLQWSFLTAIPKEYIAQGWQHLHYPGDDGPLVGLALLLGLGVVATLLLIDAAFSPFGTTLVYTAATSRIVYGMALNEHLPKIFMKENRYQIPYVSLYVNFIVGLLSFLPFPGWQKLVAFLSSASILSYAVGPICLLGMRKQMPNFPRPFKLKYPGLFSHVAFFVCNLMLYWCGFDVLYKLNIALLIGLFMTIAYQKKSLLNLERPVLWFMAYMWSFLAFSYIGSFGGRQFISFPEDLILLLPFSVFFLTISNRFLSPSTSRLIEDAIVG
jgi:amino acid transporter